MSLEPRIPDREACLYKGGKIESPHKILGRVIYSNVVSNPMHAKL
jgi:hypothetical protein